MEALEVRVYDVVRAKGGEDACRPGARAEGQVVRQIVQRGVCGGEDLEVEALIQRSWPEGGGRQQFADRVEVQIGVVGSKPLV